jgi:short-subunit dehydrogenase
MAAPTRPLAIVTGASSGIGYALATCCAAHGFDLLIAADEPAISDAARGLRTERAQVEAIEADLTTLAGVDRLYAARHGRPVEALLANAGHGLGHGFLDQDFNAVRHVIDTNIAGTLSLIQQVGRDMRARGQAASSMLDTKVGQAAKDDPADVIQCDDMPGIDDGPRGLCRRPDEPKYGAGYRR